MAKGGSHANWLHTIGAAEYISDATVLCSPFEPQPCHIYLFLLLKSLLSLQYVCTKPTAWLVVGLSNHHLTINPVYYCAGLDDSSHHCISDQGPPYNVFATTTVPCPSRIYSLVIMRRRRKRVRMKVWVVQLAQLGKNVHKSLPTLLAWECALELFFLLWSFSHIFLYS